MSTKIKEMTEDEVASYDPFADSYYDEAWDDDEEIDIEDDSYWADATEIDTDYFDMTKDSKAALHWYDAYRDDYTKEHGKSPFADAYDTAEEEGLDIQDVIESNPDNRRFNNAIYTSTHDNNLYHDGEFAEPIHQDDEFEFEESAKRNINYVEQYFAESAASDYADMLNQDDAIRARLRRGRTITSDEVEDAMNNGIRGEQSLINFFKKVLEDETAAKK